MIQPNSEADTVQVIIRRNEYCERCGGRNTIRKWRSVNVGDERMWYAKCARCGAAVKVYWTD